MYKLCRELVAQGKSVSVILGFNTKDEVFYEEKFAALGAKVKKNDYRSIDIGIAAAYITAEATAEGLGTCILGWLDDDKIRKICDIEGAVRLVITLGYAADGDSLRPKKRKDMDKLVKCAE